MGHKDFNTEGTEAKYGIKFKLKNGNTASFWYATKDKQASEFNKWKNQIGRKDDVYVSVKKVTR